MLPNHQTGQRASAQEQFFMHEQGKPTTASATEQKRKETHQIETTKCRTTSQELMPQYTARNLKASGLQAGTHKPMNNQCKPQARSTTMHSSCLAALRVRVRSSCLAALNIHCTFAHDLPATLALHTCIRCKAPGVHQLAFTTSAGHSVTARPDGKRGKFRE